MRAFAIAVVLILGTIFLSAASTANVAPFYEAFCDDGDGPLSEWVSTRYEAYLAGREHERANPRHRWEILVQSGDTAIRVPTCARLTDISNPEIVQLENTCGKCVRFTVARTNADGTLKAKEFKIDPKKSRSFRKIPDTTIKVEGERDCPE